MTSPLRPAAVLAVLLAAALLVSGCGTTATKKPQSRPAAKPSMVLPTGDVSVPPSVKITPPGRKLGFGQTATVAYEPNRKHKTVLALTVKDVRRGRISDLSAYVLDRRTRKSTPYYVHVRVGNIGTGDVGRAEVPLWLVNQDNTLIHASGFTNHFAACPSTPLPKKFGPGARQSTCLLYLVPSHGSFTAMSFRPLQAYEPITWTGKVATSQTHPNHHQKKHGKNH